MMHVYDGMLRGHFHEDPFFHQPLEVFGKGRLILQVNKIIIIKTN